MTRFRPNAKTSLTILALTIGSLPNLDGSTREPIPFRTDQMYTVEHDASLVLVRNEFRPVRSSCQPFEPPQEIDTPEPLIHIAKGVIEADFVVGVDGIVRSLFVMHQVD